MIFLGGVVGRNREIKMGGGSTVTHYFFEAKVFFIKNVGTIPRHPLDPRRSPINKKHWQKHPFLKLCGGIPKVYRKSEMKSVCIMYETSISFCFRTPPTGSTHIHFVRNVKKDFLIMQCLHLPGNTRSGCSCTGHSFKRYNESGFA